MLKETAPDPWADILRDAITASGKTQLALAAESGVAQTKISRLLSGSSIALPNAAKLARVLGLELRVVKGRR